MALARFERDRDYFAKAKFILFTNSITKVLGRFSVLYPWLSLDSSNCDFVVIRQSCDSWIPLDRGNLPLARERADAVSCIPID